MSKLTEPGTRFPFINLEKAIGRAKQIFDADPKAREMPITTVFDLWEYSQKSSGGFQTIAALKMYGLIKDSESGNSRKIALSEKAQRYFLDERPEVKLVLSREFARAPKLLAALWADWDGTPPADTVARSHLKTERKLSDQGARSLLAIYKENLAFAELKGDVKVEAPSDEGEAEDGGNNYEDPPPPPPPPAPTGQVKVMEGERIVFTEEGQPHQYLKLIASGEVDDFLLEALEDFVKRQRKRLKVPSHRPN